MMKSYMIAFGLFAMLVCSTVTMTVAASEPTPTVRLPTTLVTMNAKYGAQSWFNMTFLGINPGYDVANGSYLGWCVQMNTSMTRDVNHAVRLYSSYDPAMPVHFQSSNWDKVNYILNNKNGSRESIQDAIWYFICNFSYSSNDTQAQAMIVAANAADNVSSFIPQAGDTIAILVDVINDVHSIQRTFFELSLPSKVPIGDLVWNDWDADGIQDAGEPGIPEITVSLYTQNGTWVDSVPTDKHGLYLFGIFKNNTEYYIQFTLPNGYRFSPVNQGNDDTKDSDVYPQTGRTNISTFNPNETDMSWDAGMYVPVSPGNPGTPVPQVVPNHPPTADGTAGEPYKGFIGEELHFNGSRSYDRDGTIVSWHWSFGDGTSANGSVVTHAYVNAGTYTVLLTVTDDDGATDTFQTVANIRVPNRSPLKPTFSGPLEGNRNVSYVFTVVTTDPDNDDVRYTIVWGDGSQNTSPLLKSGQSIETLHQWNSLGFYTVRVSAQDPSNATSEMYEVRASIDVRYVGSLGYLINTDGVGPFDMFYSNQTGNMTVVQQSQTGEYLIDTNGDGKTDFRYNPSSGLIQAYQEGLGAEYMMLLVGIVIVIILVLLLAYFGKWKKGKSQ
ncbi:MAG: PKD domain-containing protein [Thermoplasmata archaeon]|nr:PKD domain-containing protein [Thermoplasmata archaeon]MBE3141131.1 PKD domain-containing protein [Thermoplasmata archaeon]